MEEDLSFETESLPSCGEVRLSLSLASVGAKHAGAKDAETKDKAASG
jgi:hypothetical protein